MQPHKYKNKDVETNTGSPLFPPQVSLVTLVTLISLIVPEPGTNPETEGLAHVHSAFHQPFVLESPRSLDLCDYGPPPAHQLLFL